MPEWERRQLDSVAEVTVGFVGTMARHYADEGVPFLRSLNIAPHRLDLNDLRFVSPEFESRLSKSRLHPGDVVTVRTGKPGTTAVIPADFPVSNCSDLVITRPGSELDARWFSYYMNSAADRHVASELVGAVQQHFNVASAKRLDLALPPLPEQQAIAEVLGALDDKIAANTKLAATADEYLASYLDTFIDRITTSAALRTIADVNAESVRPQAGDSLRYVDIASVGVGSFEYPDTSMWDDAPGRARRRLRRGDTIWSTVRPNRRSHALNLSDDSLLVASTGLAVLTPRSAAASYLYEVTRRPEFTAYLENVAEGSAYPAVRADRFNDAPIPSLTDSSRRLFEAVAEPLRESVYRLSVENRTLAATRDALLPQLMSGKFRVRDAEKLASEAGA